MARKDARVDPAVIAALTDVEMRQERRQGPSARSGGDGRRQTPVRPSEVRRRERQLSVTFSDPEIPERLRALARAWGWVAPDGASPAVSRVVEALVVPALEEAEGTRAQRAAERENGEAGG